MEQFIFDAQRFSIDNYNDNSLVSGTSYSERIENHGNNVTITGLGGSDTIWNRGSTVSADGGDDDDWLCAEVNTNKVTLQGGAGDDTLWAFSENNSMIGGAGNDFFYSGYGYIDGSLASGSSGDNNTIIGGTGDDSISFSNGTSGAAKNNLIQYAKGDGNDSVFGFSADDTLEITSGRYTTLKSGSDLIVKVGMGYITLKGAADIAKVGTNIKGLFVGKDISSNIDNTILSGSSSADYIWNNGDNVVVNGFAGNDTLGTRGNKVTINAGAGNDSIGLNDNARNIKIDCGAGNDTVNNWGDNSIIYGTGGNDYLYSSSLSAGITMSGGDGNDSVYSNSQTAIITGDAGNDYIHLYDKSSNITINGGSGSDTVKSWSKNILIRGGVDNDTIYSGAQIATIKGDTGDDYICLYIEANKNTVKGGDGNDRIYCGGKKSYLKGDAGADYIHLYIQSSNTTVTGGAGDDTIKSYSTSKVTYVYNSGDGNDVIDGVTDNDTIKIGGDSYTTAKAGNDVVVKVGTGKITLKNAVDTEFKIVGDTLVKGLKLNGNILTVTNKFTGSSINLAKYSNVKKFDGAAVIKAVKITGNSLDNSIIGGSKADTITGGAGNDTLKGNGGADLFIHTAGDDVISDYASSDKISLSGNYTGEVSGNDVILTTNKGTLTIKNSASKSIIINDERKNFSSNGSLPTGLSYNNDKTLLTVGNNFTGGTIDLNKHVGVYDVDAHECTRVNLKITGNGFNNSLVGGSGDDTIFGGNGSDTLKGGAGQDIFKYSSGNDIIKDYRAGKDKIKLSNTKIKDIKIGDNDVVLTTSTGTLKILNGAGKSVTIIDKDGKEFEQRYSANIAEILADNSIGEFENYTEKTSTENLITFAK